MTADTQKHAGAGGKVERIPAGRESWRAHFQYRNHYCPVGDERMHYLDEGEGEPVLMLHGNPTWSFYYRNLVNGLRDRHRCIVPDHIGCGLSSKPQTYPYRLARNIENIEKLAVDRLDLHEINLVVHDWGGAIGMGFAIRHPERIRRIVIFNTAAFPSARIPLRINVCRVPCLGAILIRGLNAFARGAVRMAVKKPGGLPGPIRDGYLYPYDSWRNRIALHRFVQDIPMRESHPSYSLLEKIGDGLTEFQNTPVLICWGAKDFCFNDTFLRRWEEEFTHARVHRFADAGHYVLEDAGDDILTLVRDFIDE